MTTKHNAASLLKCASAIIDAPIGNEPKSPDWGGAKRLWEGFKQNDRSANIDPNTNQPYPLGNAPRMPDWSEAKRVATTLGKGSVNDAHRIGGILNSGATKAKGLWDQLAHNMTMDARVDPKTNEPYPIPEGDPTAPTTDQTEGAAAAASPEIAPPGHFYQRPKFWGGVAGGAGALAASYGGYKLMEWLRNKHKDEEREKASAYLLASGMDFCKRSDDFASSSGTGGSSSGGNRRPYSTVGSNIGTNYSSMPLGNYDMNAAFRKNTASLNGTNPDDYGLDNLVRGPAGGEGFAGITRDLGIDRVNRGAQLLVQKIPQPIRTAIHNTADTVGSNLERAPKAVLGAGNALGGGIGYLGGKAVQGAGYLAGQEGTEGYNATKAFADSMGRSAVAGNADFGGALDPRESGSFSRVQNSHKQDLQGADPWMQTAGHLGDVVGSNAGVAAVTGGLAGLPAAEGAEALTMGNRALDTYNKVNKLNVGLKTTNSTLNSAESGKGITDLVTNQVSKRLKLPSAPGPTTGLAALYGAGKKVYNTANKVLNPKPPATAVAGGPIAPPARTPAKAPATTSSYAKLTAPATTNSYAAAAKPPAAPAIAGGPKPGTMSGASSASGSGVASTATPQAKAAAYLLKVAADLVPTVKKK